MKRGATLWANHTQQDYLQVCKSFPSDKTPYKTQPPGIWPFSHESGSSSFPSHCLSLTFFALPKQFYPRVILMWAEQVGFWDGGGIAMAWGGWGVRVGQVHVLVRLLWKRCRCKEVALDGASETKQGRDGCGRVGDRAGVWFHAGRLSR